MTEAWRNWLDEERRRRREAGLLRVPSSRRDDLISFADNDYLDLSRDPRVVAAAVAALDREGLGTRASALVQGRGSEHEALEAELASFKGSAAALLFPSGFAANMSTIACLAADDLTIYSDQFNHASIVDGCHLARSRGARVRVFRHGDLDHLDLLLTEDDRSRRLVVSESVFSMDGDLADIAGLVELRQKHEFFLVLDEAHATGVVGPEGRGLAAGAGAGESVDLQIGTLSKALGALGGFAAGSTAMIEFLYNAARGQVFSTALPAPVAAAARAALGILRDDEAPRRALDQNRSRLGQALGRELASPILSWPLGSPERTLAAAADLEERGLRVPPIRPPTVPAGSSRLRASLSARHNAAEIDLLAQALSRWPEGEQVENSASGSR